jgi:hypothetical protein
MVYLDQQLLCRARRWTTGVNAQRATELIVAYELAVDLHNGGHRGHSTYQPKSELQLRNYVLECSLRDIQGRSRAVIAEATALIRKSEVLCKRSDALNDRVDQMLAGKTGSY